MRFMMNEKKKTPTYGSDRCLVHAESSARHDEVSLVVSSGQHWGISAGRSDVGVEGDDVLTSWSMQ